ncbi:MAG: cryptochrome/photolyase family protein [Thalassotalea sp.]
MLYWFRNDLRTHDNPALHHFISNNDSIGASKAIFFISEKQWQLHDWSLIKIDLIKRHARSLKAELIQHNIELELVVVDDFSQQIEWLATYCADHNIKEVIANSELEFNEQQRDSACIAKEVPLVLFESDVIVPKGKVLNKSGTMFKVFTPFKNAWLKCVQENGFDYLGKLPGCSLANIKENSQGVSKCWPLGYTYESSLLPHFFNEKITDYDDDRDIPAIKGTSGISPYLAIGAISPRFVLYSLLHRYPDLLYSKDTKVFSWLNEIIWREFYRHLMFHEQRLCKHQEFNSKYKGMKWRHDSAHFQAWCDGKTGYPLVDAAMRQLKQTGWMHNRLRMVVASFLTKHLLIDWRLGEQYFMQHLIDGDLAANNGGWQWAASTGCDAQPYFRVFNPIRQSERFDPDGSFIRKYIPELKNIPVKHIHFPEKYINDHDLNCYWKPIVEHKPARLRAIEFFKG